MDDAAGYKPRGIVFVAWDKGILFPKATSWKNPNPSAYFLNS